jgi:hypothetical protein
MRFPSYESCDEPQEGLLFAYARFYGEYERDHTEYIKKFGGVETDNIVAIAKRIGNGCFRLGTGDKKGARRQFEVASVPLKKATSALAPQRSPQYSSALLLGHTLNMLKFRNQPRLVETERKAMHTTVASELNVHIQRGNHYYRSSKTPTRHQNGRQAERIGTINELTALGLVTRYAHPWALGTPALLHHDQGHDSVENYDNLLVEALPEKKASFYRVQLKSDCIGACKGALRETQELQSYQNTKYVPEVRIISGHCDLAFDPKNPVRNNYFPLGSLLVKEALGKPTPEDIQMLDMASDRLLFTITADERRRGTALYQ